MSGLLSAKIGLFQVADEAADQSSGFRHEFMSRFKLFLIDEAIIQRHVELRSYFAARTLGYRQELNELFISVTFESFSDVGHYRNRGTLNLVAQAEISAES